MIPTNLDSTILNDFNSEKTLQLGYRDDFVNGGKYCYKAKEDKGDYFKTVHELWSKKGIGFKCNYEADGYKKVIEYDVNGDTQIGDWEEINVE